MFIAANSAAIIRNITISAGQRITRRYAADRCPADSGAMMMRRGIYVYGIRRDIVHRRVGASREV